MQAKPKLHQSLVNPRCAVDEKGFPVFELLHVSNPSADGEYLRGIIRAVNRQPIEDDLLAALKAIQEFAHGGAISLSVDAGEFRQIRDMANAAIARAEEV